MGGQLGRIPSIPGYLCEGVCMGATREDPDTVCVRVYVGGILPSIPGYLVFQTHCL